MCGSFYSSFTKSLAKAQMLKYSLYHNANGNKVPLSSYIIKHNGIDCGF